MKKPKVITDDSTTAFLQAQHDQVQADIAKLSPERQSEIRAQQAEVDFEMGKMNAEMDAQFEIEAKWRAATGLHHRDAEKVLKSMSKEPVGKLVQMYGKTWVHTPFKTVVQAQDYVNVLQERVIALSSIPAETTIQQLTTQRAQLIAALKEFTALSLFGLMKLSIKRLFQRGNNG